MKDQQTINTAGILLMLDSLERARGPKLFRLKLWGTNQEPRVAAYSFADARLRVLEIDPSARICGIVEEGSSS
jgi:hypothetical protein